MKFIIFSLFIFTSACAAELKPKSELGDAIARALGLLGLAEEIKASNYAEAKAAMKQNYDSMAAKAPDAPPQIIDQMRIAGEKLLNAIDAAWSPKESVAIWKDAYVANFSEDELRQILERIQSPLGQKELAVSRKSLAAWRSFITQKRKESEDAALEEYRKAIGGIFTEYYKELEAKKSAGADR